MIRRGGQPSAGGARGRAAWCVRATVLLAGLTTVGCSLVLPLGGAREGDTGEAGDAALADAPSDTHHAVDGPLQPDGASPGDTLHQQDSVPAPTCLSGCAVGQWCPIKPPPAITSSGAIVALQGPDAQDLWAVHSAGRLLRFVAADPACWVEVTSSPVLAAIAPVSLWRDSAGAAHVVGAAGSLVWSGSSWSDPIRLCLNSSGVPPGNLTAVRGVGSQVLATGDLARVLKWTGSCWDTLASGVGSSTVLNSLAIASGTVYVVGHSGTVISLDMSAANASFQSHACQTKTGTADLRGVWAAPASSPLLGVRLLVAGAPAGAGAPFVVVQKVDDSCDLLLAAGATSAWNAVSGSSASGVWLVGGAGQVGRLATGPTLQVSQISPAGPLPSDLIAVWSNPAPTVDVPIRVMAIGADNQVWVRLKP